MRLFRKKTIFHVDEALPDPEEIKWRFRRRIFFSTCIGVALLLGIPVFRDIRPYLQAKQEARKLASLLYDTRLLAARNRTAMLLELVDESKNLWRRSAASSGCAERLPGVSEEFSFPKALWQISAQEAGSKEVHSASALCFDPLKGLFADKTPLQENGRLLISARPEDGSPSDPKNPKLLLTNFGAELYFLTD